MTDRAVNLSVLADPETHAFIAKMMELMELMGHSDREGWTPMLPL